MFSVVGFEPSKTLYTMSGESITCGIRTACTRSCTDVVVQRECNSSAELINVRFLLPVCKNQIPIILKAIETFEKGAASPLELAPLSIAQPGSPPLQPCNNTVHLECARMRTCHGMWRNQRASAVAAYRCMSGLQYAASALRLIVRMLAKSAADRHDQPAVTS